MPTSCGDELVKKDGSRAHYRWCSPLINGARFQFALGPKRKSMPRLPLCVSPYTRRVVHHSSEGNAIALINNRVAEMNRSFPVLSFSGLSFSGLSFSGLSFSGLSFSGLSFSGTDAIRWADNPEKDNPEKDNPEKDNPEKDNTGKLLFISATLLLISAIAFPSLEWWTTRRVYGDTHSGKRRHGFPLRPQCELETGTIDQRRAPPIMGPRTVFLYEFITAGGWHHVASGPPDGSLLAEGRAMLEAIATDFAALDNVSVNLMWDTRLERPPAGQIEIAKVCSADEELKTFASLASNCECTLIIAPEIDNWLSSKTRTAQELDALLLGPNVNFVEITSDKSLTAERLRSAGVPTPRTVRYRPGNPLPSELGERLIVKPNDGAGSTDVRKLKHKRFGSSRFG